MDVASTSKLTVEGLTLDNLPEGYLEENGISLQEAQTTLDVLRILVVLGIDTIDAVLDFVDDCDDVKGSTAWMIANSIPVPADNMQRRLERRAELAAQLEGSAC